MKYATIRTTGLFVVVVALLSPQMGLSAVQKRDPLVGDWQIKVEFNERQIESILSFSKNKKGDYRGQWLSFWGAIDLSDVKFEEGNLSFTQTVRFGDQERTSSFTGTIKRRKLSGTLSSDRGETEVEGQRAPYVPNAAGEWKLKIKVGDQEYESTLVIKAETKGQLSGQWISNWGEHEIKDIQFKAGDLTFIRASKVQDREWESTFNGTVKAGVLSGAFKGERGETPVEGTRVGADLVGRWDLTTTSDDSSRKQMLRVYPDLSGCYGSIAIDKIGLEDNRISFKAVTQFGDRNIENSFSGEINGKKLSGELTSSRGTRTVEGTKRGTGQGRLKKATRKPDVIFVPTPQEVVDKMLELAQVTKDDLVYDLGCGNGIIVVTAAKEYGCKCVGYDINRRRIRESRANVAKNNVGHLVRIEQEDIFTLNLSEANVITLYLLPELNVKLIPQLEKLKPGSRIVSHDFDMEGVTPDKVVKLPPGDEYGTHTVYLWTTPLKKENPK